MQEYVIEESEALRACASLIDAYEDGEILSEVRTAFAKRMFASLSRENAQLVVQSYPFRDIISKYDMLNLL